MPYSPNLLLQLSPLKKKLNDRNLSIYICTSILISHHRLFFFFLNKTNHPFFIYSFLLFKKGMNEPTNTRVASKHPVPICSAHDLYLQRYYINRAWLNFVTSVDLIGDNNTNWMNNYNSSALPVLRA